MFNVLFLAAASAFAQSDLVVGRIDSGAYQRVVEENLELRKEQARLEAEAGELRRKNAALLLDIQDLERKRDQLTVLISQLKTPDETRTEMARLQSEKLVLVREIERLRQALATAVTPVVTNLAPPVVAPPAGSDLFRKIEKENADLRLELARTKETAMNESVGRAVVSKSEASLKEEVAKLAGQVKQVRAEAASLQKREASLKKALEAQAKKAFEAEKEVSDQKAVFSVQKTESEALKSEIKALKASLPSPQPSLGDVASAKAAPSRGEGVDHGEGSVIEESIPSLLASAKASLAANRARDAEKLYLKVLKLEPGNAQVCYNLGVLYGDYLKEARKAAKYYRRYLELAPRAPDAAQVRSWIIELDARSKW